MLTKNEIKHLCSLHQKKGRIESNSFLCEGNKLISELLSSDFKVKRLLATNEALNEINVKNFNFDIISNKELEKITQLNTPPGWIAEVEMPTLSIPDPDKLKNELFFLLDNINDPGNLGTIIRIADWFGISTIICNSETVDVYNHKTIQASMGSIFRVKVLYISLDTFLPLLQQNAIPIYVAVMNGENDFSIQNGGLLLGSESHGVNEKYLNHKVEKITIPSFGNAESLNVAVATAILTARIRWKP